MIEAVRYEGLATIQAGATLVASSGQTALTGRESMRWKAG